MYCTRLAGSNPTEVREVDGETHLRFETDGEHVATVSVRPGRQRYAGSAGDTLPIFVSIAHREETTITGLKLELQAPPGGAGNPVRVALTVPQWKPHPSLELYTDSDDGGSILEIGEIGGQGDGTVTFELLVTALGASASELLVDATVELTEQGVLGWDYTVEGHTRVHLPDGDGPS